VQYTYDAEGNRVTKCIASPLPPEVGLGIQRHAFNEETWDREGTLRGSARDRSGAGLAGVEVSIGREEGSVLCYWNGSDWNATAEVWNPAALVVENWTYALDSGHLRDGKSYLLRARATDNAGRSILSDFHRITYDLTPPERTGGIRFIDAAEIEISFSEPVLGAEEVSAYLVSGGLRVTNVAKADEGVYRLRLSGALQPGTPYEIELSGVSDLAGNSLDPALAGTSFANHAPAAPGVNFPPEGGETAEDRPILSVNNGFDADGDTLSYCFEICRDEAFQDGIASAEGVHEGLRTTQWQVSAPLEENTFYWWRVRASDGIFCSAWCTGRFFANRENEIPSAPGILYPPDRAHVSASMPALEIANGADPDLDPLTYEFQVFSDPTATRLVWARDLVPGDPGGTTSCVVEEALDDNAFFYWRARALDEEGAAGPWSALSGFMVNRANDIPSVPAISGPSPGTEVAESAPVLEAFPSRDADLDELIYLFELDSDPSFAGPDLWRSGPVTQGLGATVSFTPTCSLKENSLYHWRVRAFDGKSYSAWAAGSFFVNRHNDPPGKPFPKSPSGNEIQGNGAVLSVVPSTDPDGDEVIYTFEVYGDGALTHLLDTGVCMDSSWEASGGWIQGRTYYWRARTTDEHGLSGEWSDPAWFRVSSTEKAPDVPVANSPLHGGILVSATPVLSVKNTAQATHYHFEIYGDADLRQPLASGVLPGGDLITSWNPGIALKEGETYYWRCRASRGALMGAWMSTSIFTVCLEWVEPRISIEVVARVVPSYEGTSQIRVTREKSPLRGAGIEIPPGALRAATEITLGIVENPPALPPGMRAAAPAVDLGPDGTTFDVPVLVSLPLDEEVLQEARASGEGALKILTFSGSLMQWQTIPVECVDEQNRVITFRVRHFSTFAPVLDLEDLPAREGAGGDSGKSGCFLSTAIPGDGEGGEWSVGTIACPAALAILALILGALRTRRKRIGKKLFVSLVVFSAHLAFFRTMCLATSAQVDLRGSETQIVLETSAEFTNYKHCNSEDPPECWDVNTGILYVYGDTHLMAQVPGEGSASWATILDGGAMNQGEHIFTAVAVDSKGVTDEAEARLTVDNTPIVSVESPGPVEGSFDFTGNAAFKEHRGGNEGTVEVYIDTQDWRKAKRKTYEGKDISWTYSEIAGETLDAGAIANGDHVIYTRAQAANGAWSEWSEGSFQVDNMPSVSVQDSGLVEGEFDVSGNAGFKEHVGGEEGLVEVYIDTQDWRKAKRKTYEGKDISWTYSE
ncbi:MAG: hypothetical protein JW821_02270, partial [Deltaproteobacteria bacterium]|nr:hypothetical protein [Deltaproteobacteria bacterium]